MSSARKLKISVTVASDLLARIDRQAAAAGGNRSAVIERLLRSADRDLALARLEESTAAYYDALTESEKAAERALSRASAKAARRLVIDDLRMTSGRPRRRRPS